jgi:hypothetical protein
LLHGISSFGVHACITRVEEIGRRCEGKKNGEDAIARSAREGRHGWRTDRYRVFSLSLTEVADQRTSLVSWDSSYFFLTCASSLPHVIDLQLHCAVLRLCPHAAPPALSTVEPATTLTSFIVVTDASLFNPRTLTQSLAPLSLSVTIHLPRHHVPPPI